MDPSRFHVMDKQLTLDPDIARDIAEIEAKYASHGATALWLSPDWNAADFSSILLFPPIYLPAGTDPLPPPGLFTPTPAAPPSAWSFKPGKGPETPKPADLSDLLHALQGLPAVQHAMLEARGYGQHQLRLLKSDWDKGSTADKVTMISVSAVVAGGILAPILATPKIRGPAFDLLKGVDIPVPYVSGLSVRYDGDGGGASYKLPMVPGLGVSGDVQASGYKFNVSFDLAEYLRAHH